MREMCVDIQNDIKVFIVIVWRSGESNPVGMAAIAIFVRETWYSVNKCPRRFLNKNNIKVFICFQNIIHKSSVLTNILQKDLEILKSYLDVTHGWTNWLVFGIPEFLIFLYISLLVKVMPLEWVKVWVSLIIAFTI